MVGAAPLSWKRILLSGIAGSFAATFINEALRRAALAVLDVPPEFMPLNGPSVIVLTLAGTLTATAVFLFLNHLSDQPWRRFVVVAWAALASSFLPDIGLIATGRPGATLLSVGILVVMHAVAFAVLMTAFWFGVPRVSEPSPRQDETPTPLPR